MYRIDRIIIGTLRVGAIILAGFFMILGVVGLLGWNSFVDYTDQVMVAINYEGPSASMFWGMCIAVLFVAAFFLVFNAVKRR